jgi:uncharacterized protein (TIGR02646 family)
VRKLDRPSLPPLCLRQFQQNPKAVWGNLRGPDRAQIWQSLAQMQDHFCAYCQGAIKPHSQNSFIEHFYQRSDYPHWTFDWNNLFGSCNTKETCGNHKDNQAKNISPTGICKPDVHDPDILLNFLASGEVQPKPGLTAQNQARAENTIKAFNLQHSSLVNRRRTIASNEGQLAEQLYEYLDEFPGEPELIQQLKEHRNRIAKEEFSAVRHTIWNS